MDRPFAIIHSIYAAALTTTPWQTIVDDMATLVDATGVLVLDKNRSEGLDEAGFADGPTANIDIRSPLLSKHPSTLPSTLESTEESLIIHLNQWDIDSNEHPAFSGHRRHCIAGYLSHSWSRRLPRTPVFFHRPAQAAPFSALDISTLGAVLPHLSQAMALRERFQASSRHEASLAIERVAAGVMVLARDRTVLLANPAASATLKSAGCALAVGERFYPSSASLCDALDKAIETCSKHTGEGHVSRSLRLAGLPGSGIVMRLTPPPRDTHLSGPAAAIGFIVQEGRSAIDVAPIMSMLYKLTPAEASLVGALFEGLSPEGFAGRRSIGVATVRTQLRSVFAKTGTQKQTELMKLMCSIAH